MIALTRSDLTAITAHGALTRLRAWTAERRQRRIDRAAFQTLLGLDDQMLRDIGVTRDEVRRAASLPLSVNAAQELEAAKRARRSW